MGQTAESLRADGTLLREAMNLLQERIGPQKYNAWFRHGLKVDVESAHLRIAVPNSFVANWIEQHYLHDLSEVFAKLTGLSREATVRIDPGLSGECRQQDLDRQAEVVSRATQGRARHRKPQTAPTIKHHLESFLIGPANRLAFKAAEALAMGKTPHASPLFIHGPCGVGKTHLLQGICNAVAAKRPGTRWRYVTAEQFTNEFVQSVRNHRGSEFRTRYRNLDVLAIDDVHFLAAKRATQEEFLHTFNAIEAAGKQVVLASDAHPRLVTKLHEQLLSRFVSGMVVKVEAPGRETRLAILKTKARQMNLEASTEVLDYIAMHIRGSVRELEGTLVSLSAYASLQAEPLDLPQVRDLLADQLVRTDSILTLGDIESVVSAFFGVTPADLHSSRRTKTVSTARMVTMFLGRRHTMMSYPEIGAHLGKNHSSVVLGVQRLEKILATHNELTWNAPAGVKTMAADLLLEVLEEQIR